MFLVGSLVDGACDRDVGSGGGYIESKRNEKASIQTRTEQSLLNGNLMDSNGGEVVIVNNHQEQRDRILLFMGKHSLCFAQSFTVHSSIDLIHSKQSTELIANRVGRRILKNQSARQARKKKNCSSSCVSVKQ